MYIQTNALMRKLDNYKKVLIWGAGLFGAEIFEKINNVGIKNKVQSFIVSSLDSNIKIQNMPVVVADQLHDINDDYVILIAVINQQYLKEIMRKVYDKGYKNVIKLQDYCINIENERRLLREETFSSMLNYIAEWYMYHYAQKSINYMEVKKFLFELSCERTPRDKEIVFIVGSVYVRTAKISIALKQSGYKVKILQISSGEQYAGYSDLVEQGIDIELCNDVSELLYKALKEKPFVYYIDPPWMDSSLAMFMIFNKDKFGKIIFGEYDVQNIGKMSTNPGHYYLTEQYAIENADGVVWRWYEAENYLTQQCGFHCKGKTIQFYDFCSECYQNIRLEEDQKLKFCMLLSQLEEIVDLPKIDRKYTHSADIYEILDLIGNREDCMLDIFIWAYCEKNLRICKEVEKKYANVKFFFQIPHSDLIKQIGKYDYGLSLFKESEVPQYYHVSIANFITEATSEYAASNRYFDYLASGIPVITHLSRKQTKYMDQWGIVVKMDVDHFDIEYLKKNKEIYRNRVKKAQEYLLINNRIKSLIDFIEEVGNS